jgi:hypothetical protein
MSQLMATAEAFIPTDPEIDRLVERLAPDALIVTPLVDFNSYQVDYVKTARRMGVPVALAVASWDNLTNKGVIAVQPHRVFVWNDIQKKEAIELHGVPSDRVTVTGAALFDEWFARSPSSSRQMFCARLGFDPEKPYFLYLCSSLFIAQDEVPFVRQWLTRLRHSTHPALRECSVLVRPHPGHAVLWRDVDLSSFGNVVIWPREGAMPLYVDTKAEYFDSLHHSAGVVGVNTSGLIEAGVLGRRSFTVLAEEFALTQSGTIHFGYLADPGFLSVARTFDEHHAQLAAELDRPSSHEDFARFIQDFVRPAGLDLPATPRLVDAIERLEQEKPAPVAAGRVRRHLRSLVRHRLGGRKASGRPGPTAASSADR